jgi:hypothetical protein
LLQCRTDALFALLGRPLARGLGLAAGCSRVGRGALLDVAHEFASFGQMLLQADFAPERRRPGIGAHPHAVLRHARQDARVDRRAPSVAAPRLDRLKQPAQVLLLDVAPHQTCAMLLAQQRLQVRRPQFDLAAVGPQQARRALPLGRRLRLPRPLGLPLIYPRQVLEQTAARFVLVLGFADVQHQASCMPAGGGRRKTLTLSVQAAAAAYTGQSWMHGGDLVKHPG